MNLIAWCLEGSLDLWLFKILLRSVLSILCLGEVVVTLEGGCFMSSAIQLIWLAESISHPNADTSHMTTRSKFQNVQFACIKQRNSRDVPEGLDDTTVLIIGDGGSHVLDTVTVFHLTFGSSHSLRGIDFFYIISDLKSLETQNSLPGLLVAFNHHRKFRSLL